MRIREKSANGVPRPTSEFMRRCETCGASFWSLAPGKTGEEGIWREWKWYCSVECAPKQIGNDSDNQESSPPPAIAADGTCSESKRVDGPWHSWRFDGDDPYIVCVFCGEMRDAISGRVVNSDNQESSNG